MNAPVALPDLDQPQSFAAPWEAQIFAIVVKLHQAGLFQWEQFAARLSAEIHAHPNEAYYHCWAQAAIDLLKDDRLIGEAELLEQTRAVMRYRQQNHNHVARASPITIVPATK
jgi:nitrile hydratase accessory protein